MGGMGLYYVIMIAVFIGFFYFMVLRPQKKQEQKAQALLNSLEIGDSVVTTAGFYGVIIDIIDEQGVIIVEFGNNKNCRIPMKKGAVVEVEKAVK